MASHRIELSDVRGRSDRAPPKRTQRRSENAMESFDLFEERSHLHRSECSDKAVHHISPSNGHSIRSPSQMMMKPSRSKMIPARIIEGMLTRPEPYTIALGGVETGSMKP